MTKKEIVKRISEELGLTQLQTKKIVQMTFDAIIEALANEGRIELRNFGVFEVKKRAARKARNPRSNASVFVPEKYVVTFKPGKEMEEQVRDFGNDTSDDAAETPSSAGTTPSQLPPSSGGQPAGGQISPATPSYPGSSLQSESAPAPQPRYVPDENDSRY